MHGTGNRIRLGRTLVLGGLLALLLAGGGCALQSQVLDAGTGQPLAGAAVLGVWIKHGGVPGLPITELVGVREAETDTEGRFELERPGIIGAEERVTVYKFGYVAWNNALIFAPNAMRADTSVPAQILLDRFPRCKSHQEHLMFLRASTWSSVSAARWVRFREALYREETLRTAPVAVASGQICEVAVGDEIPGHGRVREITARDVIVEQRVSEVEQERLRQSGKAVYQILEYRLPRADAGANPQLPFRPAPLPSQQLQLPSR